MVRRSLMETLLLDEPSENLGEFLQRDEAGDFFDEVGERFFDELQNGAHFLDADEIAGVLAVEVGEVEDHHFERLPEFDAGFLQDLLILLSTQTEGWPKTVFDRGEGDVVAAQGLGRFVDKKSSLRGFCRGRSGTSLRRIGIFIGFQVGRVGPDVDAGEADA